MKKITINEIDEVMYYEQLDNGLEIYMAPKETVNNIYVTFNTKYGSALNEFIPIKKKKMIKVPNGIAHFLEHKLFEQEDGIDPFVFFAGNGADVNAFTTLFNTSYLFYGPNHFKENINFLLDYVQKPYLTDENVEKEKGIIEQEIKMYEDDPYFALDDGIRLNTYINHPARYSIGGTVEDIKEITKEQLLDCYNTFYHPLNMFVIITGKFDPTEAVNIIKDNQANKEFPIIKEIMVKEVNELNKVYKEHEEKELNVEISKLAFSIKIPTEKISLDVRKRNNYISILIDSLFGSTSYFNERMKELEYTDSSISIGYVYTEKHILVILDCNTKKPKELITEIKKQLKSIKIDNEDFERKKKVLISSKLYLFEDIKATNHYILNDLITYNKFNNNVIQLLRELDAKEFQDLIKTLDLSNTATYVIKPIKKK